MGGEGERYVNKLLQKKNWYKNRKKEVSTVEDQNVIEGGGKRQIKEVENKQYGGDHSKKRGEWEEQEPETVMFVPSTPRGELVKAMKEADNNFRKGTKIKPIKFIERAGISMTDMLLQSNPWGDMKCGREGCFVCRAEKGGIKDCMKESVLYSIKCDDCTERGRETKYWGETGRDGFIRGGEHLKGCSERREDNALWKHLRGGERRRNLLYENRERL